MGDHNVVSGRVASVSDSGLTLDVAGGGQFAAPGQGPAAGEAVDIAIRTDRVMIGETSLPGFGFNGVVTNIEYRGSTVKLSLAGAGVDDFTAILRDDDFFSRTISVGDALPLMWNPGDVIVLGKLEK
nr:TOBE domain-containing protein [Rhizobium sp. FKL33]